MTLLTWAHAVATLFLVGLIWYVQVVQYPLFAAAGRAEFGRYHAEHVRRTGLVVAPAMAVEALTATALLAWRPHGVAVWLAWLGVGLIAVVWVSTRTLQIPAHRSLGRGFDPGTHRRLVVTNWIRTAAWTARAPIALAMLTPTPA